MDFDKCKYPYNHHAKQDTENLHNPKKFPWAPFQVVSSFLCLYPIARQHLLWFLTQCINLPLLETHVNEIIPNVYHVRLLSLSLMFFFLFLKIHSCYVLVIYSTSFLSGVFYSEFTTIYFCTQPLMDICGFSVWTIFYELFEQNSLKKYISLFFLSKHLEIGLQNHRVYA